MPASKTADSPNDPRWEALAQGMDRYHSHFRAEFDRVYKLADGSFHKHGLSLPRFLREAQQLSSHLDMHHRIEETYIFPILAKKMPQFGAHSHSHSGKGKGKTSGTSGMSGTSADPEATCPTSDSSRLSGPAPAPPLPGTAAGDHLRSHKAIHAGLDAYDAFIRAAIADPSNKYSSTELREIMDGFRDVLFRHLDEEVRDLGGASLRAAGWTLQELRQIPM